MMMEIVKPSTFLSFAPLLLFLSLALSHEARDRLQTFIVHVQTPDVVALAASYPTLEAWHRSFLPEIPSSGSGSPSRMLYSYKTAISGFAARLTEEEVKAMEKKEGFIRARPARLLPLLTTHTPSFLGLQTGNGGGVWNDSRLGEGVIIGMVDTGVTPGHPSFNDAGMPAPPSKWKGKGVCQRPGSPCNNKLIGARTFVRVGAAAAAANTRRGSPAEDKDAVDPEGHGTHTASTAAGNFVENADVLGEAKGSAAGMAPRAHLAAYKVCNAVGCNSAVVLAGIDAAIEDGVDVISISIGGSVVRLYNDDIAIGAFAAISKGIFVSCSGGNDGPIDHSLSNEAPWILTVGASTIDRSIVASLRLGDGQEFEGQSLFQPSDFTSNMLQLVSVEFCQRELLRPIDVRGKIVLCMLVDGLRTSQSSLLKEAGAAAVILMNTKEKGFTTFAEAHEIATSHVSYLDGLKIRAYANSTNQKPTATIIFKGTRIGTSPAPTVASFSSRGPSTASPNIMKPDITGPGVNILAAWAPVQVGSPSASHSNVTFNMISGTSMATPHLSGIAALVKSVHPDWSAAAIKSAIMTTADIVDRQGEPIKDEQLQPAGFFAMGAGHVNPSKAMDPGLVYDLNADDYVPYLCGLGYNDTQVGSIVGSKISCSGLKIISESELNYPSITVTLYSSTVAVNRTLTNVGEANSTYSVEIQQPEGVAVSVVPEKLQFLQVNEKKSFTVMFKMINRDAAKFPQGDLKWVYGKRVHAFPFPLSSKWSQTHKSRLELSYEKKRGSNSPIAL